MTSPAIGRRELGLVLLGGLALACAMFWPLPVRLGDVVPKDLGDPLSQAWQLAWGGHALTGQPLDFFQSNQFWPTRDSLALSDALVGWAPLAVPGEGVTDAVARYGIVFLLASALAFAGAYLLARELGAPVAAACVAGVAFAYAPWRLEQGGHLHILSSGGIPLSLFLLVRGYRSGSDRAVVAGWAVAAWQVSIGFSLGLPFLVLVLAPVAGWVLLRRMQLRATAAGLAILLAATTMLAIPYLRVRADEPAAERSAETVAVYSAGPKMFATSSALNPIWGPPTEGLRDDLPAVPEQTLFPGLAILGLAALGARRRPGLAAAAAGFAVLSLGFETSGAGQVLPYRALYEAVPGWSGIRVPERLHTFTTLALALLAAAGAARLPRAAIAVAAVLVLAEGAGFGPGRWYPHPPAPPAPAGFAGVAAPVLHLPVQAADNRRYLLWSTDGLPPMVNGRSSITPRRISRLLADAQGFPDRRSVTALRALGLRSVVLHADRLGDSPWAAWRQRPLQGLGLSVRTVGTLVVFGLR